MGSKKKQETTPVQKNTLANAFERGANPSTSRSMAYEVTELGNKAIDWLVVRT